MVGTSILGLSPPSLKEGLSKPSEGGGVQAWTRKRTDRWNWKDIGRHSNKDLSLGLIHEPGSHRGTVELSGQVPVALCRSQWSDLRPEPEQAEVASQPRQDDRNSQGKVAQGARQRWGCKNPKNRDEGWGWKIPARGLKRECPYSFG